MAPYWETRAHKDLVEAAASVIDVHLRDLLKDESRNSKLIIETEGVVCDFSRQKLTTGVMSSLFSLAKERGVSGKIAAMFAGERVNATEGRAVLHMALRSHPSEDEYAVDGKSVVEEVHSVLTRIHQFSDQFRSGEWRGFTGKALKDVICVGIGGSYLGPEFVLEALRTYKPCKEACQNRRLRFLANVDPIDVARATEALHPETTLIVVISKTFMTAETMLNARTLRQWLLSTLKDESAIGKHMVAVSTNLKATAEFGILSENVFGFWDWVGGRFSVCSAVGCVPLSLHFGFGPTREFLDGCRAMDRHFRHSPLQCNMPAIMALVSVWNSTYLHFPAVAVLPYCQALLRFAAHVQQLTMESNGKSVTSDGTPLPAPAGELFFGEPGTNGQHSFYQLLHQGRVVPADFIGFCSSQHSVVLQGEPVSNHDELMSNFFAQPNALAMGKSAEQCKAEGVPAELVPHRVFEGDRPSTSLLLPVCDPRNVGLLLALYEHRTAVQGFVWGINSFDQWGVELGKALAGDVRIALQQRRLGRRAAVEVNLPSSSIVLMEKYMQA